MTDNNNNDYLELPSLAIPAVDKRLVGYAKVEEMRKFEASKRPLISRSWLGLHPVEAKLRADAHSALVLTSWQNTAIKFGQEWARTPVFINLIKSEWQDACCKLDPDVGALPAFVELMRLELKPCAGIPESIELLLTQNDSLAVRLNAAGLQACPVVLHLDSAKKRYESQQKLFAQLHFMSQMAPKNSGLRRLAAEVLPHIDSFVSWLLLLYVADEHLYQFTSLSCKHFVCCDPQEKTRLMNFLVHVCPLDKGCIDILDEVDTPGGHLKLLRIQLRRCFTERQLLKFEIFRAVQFEHVSCLNSDGRWESSREFIYDSLRPMDKFVGTGLYDLCDKDLYKMTACKKMETVLGKSTASRLTQVLPILVVDTIAEPGLSGRIAKLKRRKPEPAEEPEDDHDCPNNKRQKVRMVSIDADEDNENNDDEDE